MNFSDYGIHVSGTGEVRTLCPMCSANRKKKNEKCLAVNTTEGTWLCHHCGWAGGLNEKNHKVFPDPKTELPEKVLSYFAGRGIPAGILDQEHIGYETKAGKGWIKFPYFHRSVCVNIKYRSGTKDFYQEKGGKKCLYRLDKISASTEKFLVITEGEIDALSFLVSGFEATSVPDGAPSPGTKNFQTKFDFLKGTEKVFDRFEKIIIAGDKDEAGLGMIRELGRRIGYEKCLVIDYPDGCKDANDVLVRHGSGVLQDILAKAKPFPVEGIISPADCLDQLMVEYQSGVEHGLSTGWKAFDEFYTVRVGEMTIITGIPGSGKSNFLDAMCINLVLKHRWRIGYFSPENWPVQRHIKTLLEKLMGKTFEPSQYGERMHPDEVRAGTSYLEDYIRFIIPKDELMTVDTILKFARILCLQYGIKGLVLDPWNEVEHDLKHGEREDMYISRQLTKIRRFARFNGLHIWVVAHPTKLQKNSNGTYDPPTMYDISGGAHWRNKADNGLCVYRDFETNRTTVLVQKIRFREIGKLGECDFKYRHTGNYEAF
jgi:twinkle protein